MNKKIKEQLNALKSIVERFGHSTKPSRRLQVSMARQQQSVLMATLKGSVRRGLQRGKINLAA